MEEIVKYKTSDGVEWEERAPAEEHEQYVNLKKQIKEHKESIEALQDQVRQFQSKCSHSVQYEPVERPTTRSGDNDGYDRYSIKVLETTYHCAICNKSWIHKRDL